MHIPTTLFNQAVSLSKQGKKIVQALDNITVFNAGKQKEEALQLLRKWFPQMENFLGQLKKYQVTIDDLISQNRELEARAKAGESGKLKNAMERAKQESELRELHRLMDRIPPELLAELKQEAKKEDRNR